MLSDLQILNTNVKSKKINKVVSPRSHLGWTLNSSEQLLQIQPAKSDNNDLVFVLKEELWTHLNYQKQQWIIEPVWLHAVLMDVRKNVCISVRSSHTLWTNEQKYWYRLSLCVLFVGWGGGYINTFCLCVWNPCWATDCAICNSLTSNLLVCKRACMRARVRMCLYPTIHYICHVTNFPFLSVTHTNTPCFSRTHVVMYLVKFVLMTQPGPLNCIYKCN